MKVIKILLILLAVLVLSGFTDKAMISTPFYEGKEVVYAVDSADRLNLWPLVYWREPVGSVVWPLVSFSDDHFAVRPLYSQFKQNGKDGEWDEFNFLWPIGSFTDNYFAIIPIYSQYKQTGKDGEWDDFNFLWPIFAADLKHQDYRAMPVFWGKDCKGSDYQCVFPFYWNEANYNSLFPIWYYGSTTNSWNFNTLAGLSGAYKAKSGYCASWMFPLWYEDNTGLFATLVYGQTTNSYWVFPLWYKGEKALVSPFFAQGEDDDKSWWAVPVFFSWGTEKVDEKGSRDEGNVLFGFGHWDQDKNSKRVSSKWWAFPFVQHSQCEYLDDTKNKPYTETFAANYLAGWTTKGEDLKSLYVFPFFGWSDDGSWLTPLGGQINWNNITNTIITPLVGVTSGKKTGGWLLPIWSNQRNVDFDEKVVLVNSPTLPDAVKVSVTTNTYNTSENFGKTHLDGTYFYSADDTKIVFHNVIHSICGYEQDCWYNSPTNKYKITESYKRGNKLLFNYEFDHSVTFDLKTKAKLADKEKSEASLLLCLYTYEWNHDCISSEESKRHRVLWRLWDWVEKDGDKTLDVFPGFTYDSHKDGYLKTSFLWRLFRYESAPKSGTKVDFLFLPIWR